MPTTPQTELQKDLLGALAEIHKNPTSFLEDAVPEVWQGWTAVQKVLTGYTVNRRLQILICGIRSLMVQIRRNGAGSKRSA